MTTNGRIEVIKHKALIRPLIICIVPWKNMGYIRELKRLFVSLNRTGRINGTIFDLLFKKKKTKHVKKVLGGEDKCSINGQQMPLV